MKKANALHVTFNADDPIILVGDNRGGVNSFKLSNALRKGPLKYEPPKDEEKEDKNGENKKIPTTQELEMQKMEKYLDSLDKQVY